MQKTVEETTEPLSTTSEQRWRMVLGQQSDPQNSVAVGGVLQAMDQAMEALYNSERKGGLGASSPNVNRWLGDIRQYFPSAVVQIMQRDAIERLGLKELFLQPEILENLEPDIHLVGTILSLKKIIPSETKSTARVVVRKVVEELEERLRNPLKTAIQGAVRHAQRQRRPKWNDIDWHRTIKANLKHYQPDLKTVIPEQLIGFGRKSNALKHIVLLVDQSGSMASSVVYASVCGAVMASLPAVKTHFIVFDTAVADLTEHLKDPVDLLFGTQLGGGTDIAKALVYAQTVITQPKDTILVLLTDLFEGGNLQHFYEQIRQIIASDVRLICLLALSDQGAPFYDKNVAMTLANYDIPVFACTPNQFPNLMAKAIKGEQLTSFS